jgi:hypothetical protein
MEKVIKGYTAIFDNLNGSFDYICSAKTEEECRRNAEKSYDSERVRVYPYYDSPFEVL